MFKEQDFWKYVVDGHKERRTDMETYRAAIAAKKLCVCVYVCVGWKNKFKSGETTAQGGTDTEENRGETHGGAWGRHAGGRTHLGIKRIR